MQGSRSLFALAVLPFATSAVLSAQVLGGIAGGVASISTGGPQAPRAPYTYTSRMTSVQTLADGTTITHTSTTKHARDSQGRIYTEAHQTPPLGAQGQQEEIVQVFIFDPVTLTNTNWNSRAKIATVVHMRDPQKTQPPKVQMPSTEIAPPPQPPADRPRPQITREDLGFRTIAGIEAKGGRMTQTIPAGEQGNDRPITIVTETWTSREYGIALLTSRDDPRIGKQTTEVTDFQPGEPDPALFQIPEGYTVREQNAGQPE